MSRNLAQQPTHSALLDGARAEAEVRVEIVAGEATDEQRVAYKRFMDWYRAKIVIAQQGSIEIESPPQ